MFSYSSYRNALVGLKEEPPIPVVVHLDDSVKPDERGTPEETSAEAVADFSLQHGSNSPDNIPEEYVIVDEIINNSTEAEWITVTKKNTKKGYIHPTPKWFDNDPNNRETTSDTQITPDEEMNRDYEPTVTMETLEKVLKFSHMNALTVDIKDAYIQVINKESETNLEMEDISIVEDSDAFSDNTSIQETTVELTSAKVTDSENSTINSVDSLNDDDTIFLTGDESEEFTDIKNTVRVHSMTLSEYSNGFFDDYDNLHITPGQQILPERKDPLLDNKRELLSEIREFKHTCFAVTRSGRESNTTAVTPIFNPEPDVELENIGAQNDELVDAPTVNENEGLPENLNAAQGELENPNQQNEVEEQNPVLPQQRDLLVTPTNQTDGNESQLNDGSISITVNVPRLSAEDERIKYVALSYMKEVLGLELPDDMHIDRIRRVFDGIPPAEVDLFSYEFVHGPGTGQLVDTNEPTRQLFPQPPPNNTPMEESPNAIGNGQNTGNSAFNTVGEGRTQFNEATPNIRNRRQNNERSDDRSTDSSHSSKEERNLSISKRKIEESLNKKVISFPEYFQQHAHSQSKFTIQDVQWFRIREEYVKHLIPSDDTMMREAQKAAHKLYKDISKTSPATQIEEIKHFASQKKRSEHYRTWIQSLYFILLHDSWAAQLINERGRILVEAAVPWYVLKAAALIIQSKISATMRHHYHNIDKDDPIAILLKFEDICGGVNEITKQEIKLEYESLCIGENESASNFMTRALKVFDKSYLYGFDLPEAEKVDKIIFALRGNTTYEHQRSIFQDKRRTERRYPDRPYDDNLTIHEIITVFNNLDGEIYEGVQRKQKRQKQNSSQRANNVSTPTTEVNQANVATRKENQFRPNPCFHCKSPKHTINNCPTATIEQKEQAWAKFHEEQAKRRSAAGTTGADKTFVPNRFKGTNTSNEGTSGKGKRVRFSKGGKPPEANCVTVTHISDPNMEHISCNVFDEEPEVNQTHNTNCIMKGIPPVHQSGIGNNPTNYWLVDSGTSAHMTPYIKDLDTDTFRPGSGHVRVADAGRAQIIGTGNVTILIKCYETGRSITWTLYDVLVVPGLVRRLISTDELSTKWDHSITFESSGTVILLREEPDSNKKRRVTIIKVPSQWDFDDVRNQYHWPKRDYELVSYDTRPSILVSPVFINTNESDADDTDQESCVATTDQTLVVDHQDEAEEVRNTKRVTYLQTIHHRLGHRSYESLLLGNRDNIWNDVQIKRDPETICQTCQITLARKTARNRKTPKDFPTEPGRMVMTDIIANPFNEGLTDRSHFDYYLLIVDVFSSLPVLLGLRSLTATNVIRTLKLYMAMIKPDINQPRPEGQVNVNHLQHIRADAGTQFTSAEFLQACSDAGINVSLAAPKHQEMNGLCERTWQSVRNLAFSFMNFARVDETFGDMALEHAWKVFSILPIKGLRKESNVTTPYELFYGTKPSIRKFRVLFCPCVYKVYNRQKKIKSTIRRYDSKTHPQRGVIGIFCGFPRSQAGFLIWEPRSKQLKVSADVQFDEKFHSMGPRKHFAFEDALPVVTKHMRPDIAKFKCTDSADDHDGIPQTEYTEENITDGFLNLIRCEPKHELFENDLDTISDHGGGRQHTVSSDHSNDMEEDKSDDGYSSMEESDSASSRSSRKPKHTKSTNTRHPTVNERKEDAYSDPSELVQRPTRQSTRQRKPRRIFDPSSNCIDVTNWSNIVTHVFDENVAPEDVLQYVYQIARTKANDMDGADPAAYLPEPKSLKRVSTLEPHVRDAWLKAFRSELMNLIGKNTFVLPQEYNGERCLPVCAIFKTKIKADGNVDKLKVRIAIRGDLDRDALEEDNSAPLATFRLLKVFLAEAARQKRRVYQADFIGAYLQANMDRLVYVRLPKEYAEYFPDLAKWFGVPLILKKSAYGINSAGRLWAEELFGWYTEFGFIQSTVEPSLFKYKSGNEWITLLSYCDDTAYFASSDETRKMFELAMCKRFDCKLLGQLHWFLQARITQDERFNITIDQSRYSASMCKRFLPQEEIMNPSEEDKKKYLAPLPAGLVFTKVDRSKDNFSVKQLQDEFQLKYPVVIGSLLWILNTYPRLQFAIRKLAKFMNLPGRVHFKALRHLLQHVRCHHQCGITFYSDIISAPVSRLLFPHGINTLDFPFFAFADSSWQDCPDTSRSTGGYHIIFQGGIVDSATTFPTPVSRSSAEAEYMNASCASAAVNAMAMLIQDIQHGEPDKPLRIPMLLDNKACIAMGESFKDSKRTRHILRGYHYVRWMIKEGRLVLVWIPANIQMADPATKNLLGAAETLVTFREVFETIVLM